MNRHRAPSPLPRARLRECEPLLLRRNDGLAIAGRAEGQRRGGEAAESIAAFEKLRCYANTDQRRARHRCCLGVAIHRQPHVLGLVQASFAGMPGIGSRLDYKRALSFWYSYVLVGGPDS
jgi:hypothetical protein